VEGPGPGQRRARWLQRLGRRHGGDHRQQRAHGALFRLRISRQPDHQRQPDGLRLGPYQFQWAKSTNGGSTWSAWGYDGATHPAGNHAKGDRWKVRARTTDGAATSAWKESASVTVGNGNTAPTAPTAVVISPASPAISDNLTASASGGTDADGDTITYEYQWAKSTDDGGAWSAWGNDGATLAASNTKAGDRWKARARANDGSVTSAWTAGNPVSLPAAGNTAPTTPASVVIAPAQPGDNDDLMVTASGSTDADGDAITYEYRWARNTGSGFGGYYWSGAVVPGTTTNDHQDG